MNVFRKLQPNCPEIERKLFHDVLNKLIENTDDHSMKWNEVYTLNGEQQTSQMPKQRMQDLLQTWVDQGYFLEQDENIYLGARTLVEYNDYFRNKYSSVLPSCPLCRGFVFWVGCTNNSINSS